MAGDLLSAPALTMDGRRISVEFTIVILRDSDGAPTGMAAIMRDVTVRFEEMRALGRKSSELEALRLDHSYLSPCTLIAAPG